MQEEKSTFMLRVLNPETQCELECKLVEGETIVDAVRKVDGKHPLVGCLGGGCGICRVQVTSGEFIAEKMSATQVSKDDVANGIVLACKTRPTGNLSCTVLGRRPYEV